MAYSIPTHPLAKLSVHEDPFFSILMGKKKVDLRCIRGSESVNFRIWEHYQLMQKPFPICFSLTGVASTKMWVNKCVFYESIEDALTQIGVDKVLPDRAETVDEGVQIYRKYYTVEDETNGVVALYLNN